MSPFSAWPALSERWRSPSGADGSLPRWAVRVLEREVGDGVWWAGVSAAADCWRGPWGGGGACWFGTAESQPQVPPGPDPAHGTAPADCAHSLLPIVPKNSGRL